jgi:hypothetical protein
MGRDEYADKLDQNSYSLRSESERLRDVSNRLLQAIDAMRHLEREARKLPTGTPEFERVSAEITARAREVFSLAGEQEEAARELPAGGPPINELADPESKRAD